MSFEIPGRLGAVSESDQTGPFVGVGPHDVPSGVKAMAGDRGTFAATFTISDAVTREIYYVGHVDVHKADDVTISLTNYIESFAAAGWERDDVTVDILGNLIVTGYSYKVSATVTVVDDLIIGHVTMPSGQPPVYVAFAMTGYYLP